MSLFQSSTIERMIKVSIILTTPFGNLAFYFWDKLTTVYILQQLKARSDGSI